MKKYSKNNLKKKRFLIFLLVFFIFVLIASVSFLVFVKVKNNIVYAKIDDSALTMSDDVSTNATPIIVNNLLVGGVYDKKWVSSENYYLKSKYNTGTEIDLYGKNGKLGKYKIEDISKPDRSSVYVTTSKINSLDEYFAVATSESNIMSNLAKQDLNVNENDISNVKKALGIYRIFNTSVKICEKYNITLNPTESGNLIFVTNEVGKGVGVYSAVVYISNSGKTYLIKYNYINDTKKAEEWPIYSYGFVGDLNYDGTNDIIIQETKEFEVVYSVIQFNNNKFYDVLNSSVKK